MHSALKHQLLTDFQGHRVDYPADRTTIHLIEEQARRAPQRPALLWDDTCLTYGEIIELAAAWAGELRRLGVRRGDLLPVITAGGQELAVVMLATMKLGAPFVPIDDAWPEHRLHESVTALRPPLAVRTGPGPVPALGVPVLRVTGTGAPDGVRPVRDAVPGTDELIYGFFTSGSTGTPKCALNGHLGLLNRFLTMTRRFGAGPDVVLQNSRHVFDSSMWQLLWPLTKGSRVVLPRREGVLDLTRTIDEIARHRVTMTDFVPSVFNTLVDLLDSDPGLPARLSSLRHLLIGGEAIDPSAVRSFRELLPEVRLTNTYGPTECSIGSVFHEISDADTGPIPIGRPIDNTCAVLLDGNGALVTPGQVGEIHLGGDCLGAGYLHDPARTADAFVENPFPELPGRRLYRSGDLAWQRPDGLLMFVGRQDQQVKLGGVLIDLLEVEATVATHPRVVQARAVIHGEGDLRSLVCCVTTDTTLTSTELDAHSRALLPAHAVPRTFLLLDQMPLTPNGKTDRRALAELASLQLAGQAEGGRLTAQEEAVAALWRELLADLCGAAPGPEADFYALGGTSLTLQRLSAAMHRAFGVRVPPRHLAAAATLREQAALLHHDGASPDDRALLLADIARASVLRPWSGPTPTGEPLEVLLTGVTGFIGAHVLAELLDRTDAVVHCLLRTSGQADRVAEVMARLGRPYDARRIVLVPGDLAQPRLGLSTKTWTRLAGRVDSLLHCGALVNLALGYPGLRAPNVVGAGELLRLATIGRPKRLHHLSTLGVFPDEDGRERVLEEDPLPEEPPEDGYSRSKWAAEQLLTAARAQGVPVTVHRLGEVMPHSLTGAGNRHAQLDLLLRACARLGLSPRTTAVTDWTPVDEVATAVVGALGTGRDSETFHLLRPGAVPLEQVLAALAELVPLRPVDYPDFYRAVAAGGDESPLLTFLPEPDTDGLNALFRNGHLRFSAKRGTELADSCGLAWHPTTDTELLNCTRWIVHNSQ
ncbi:amino acid adenylation domain-containing protein [Streptomyces sp. NPDC058470]|uniref:non-ribosomal peptide synthetase n=1 Tax=Streptomyces sp. NPDC058470 TaxID=3346515 RepID=UPI003662510B